MIKKRILVTGASGFIGLRLCERLQAEGHTVVALGRHACAGPWDRFIEYDLSRGEGVLDLDGVEVIHHLASKAHALSETVGETAGYDAVIVDGTKRLLEAAQAAEVGAFIYASSVKVFGEGDFRGLPINERAEARPGTPYGRAKLEAEQLVRESQLAHTVILRPAMVYGPGHKGNLVRMAEAIRQRRFPPLRENHNRRSILHVDDLVEAFVLAARTPTANREVITIAGNRAYSTKQLYDQLRQELGLKPIDWHVPDSLLFAGAKLGDWLGQLSKKRMPLDTDTLIKLYGSAHYDNSKSRRLLGLTYGNEDRPLLE